MYHYCWYVLLTDCCFQLLCIRSPSDIVHQVQVVCLPKSAVAIVPLLVVASQQRVTFITRLLSNCLSTPAFTPRKESQGSGHLPTKQAFFFRPLSRQMVTLQGSRVLVPQRVSTTRTAPRLKNKEPLFGASPARMLHLDKQPAKLVHGKKKKKEPLENGSRMSL